MKLFFWMFTCWLTKKHKWSRVPDGGTFRYCTRCGDTGWEV